MVILSFQFNSKKEKVYSDCMLHHNPDGIVIQICHGINLSARSLLGIIEQRRRVEAVFTQYSRKMTEVVMFLSWVNGPRVRLFLTASRVTGVGGSTPRLKRKLLTRFARFLVSLYKPLKEA